MVLNDDGDPTMRDEHQWLERNPVVTEALVQLTTGGPQTVYWGGLARGLVRYFDAAERRPGLPPDVAALVRHFDAQSVELTLINVGVGKSRDVIIGAGSFAEHTFTTVSEPTAEPGRTSGLSATVSPVDGTYVQVHLRPGTEIDLRLGLERNCNRPTYAFPWHGHAIPFR